MRVIPTARYMERRLVQASRKEGIMSEPSGADLNIRRYLIVFGCMVLSALLTVGISLLPLGNHKINIGLALAFMAVQTFLVLGFMMHLLSEKKLVLILLGFTVFFVSSLVFGTWDAMHHVVTIPRH